MRYYQNTDTVAFFASGCKIVKRHQ